MNFREMTTEQLSEESFIDLAFTILEDKREAITLKELLAEIQKLNGFSDEQIEDRMLQFYTDMNIDGRFLATGANLWGLREWYPVEQIEEETAPTVKVRKKKAKAVEVDDEEFEEEDEDEIDFDEDFDEFVEDDDDDEEEEEIDFVEEEEEDEEEIEEVDEDLLVDDDDYEIVEEDEETTEEEE